ncbi:cytochrome c1 [Verminephrobacter aporrectodeae]|uniref:Cytochrome c1 n=1 Tax=Verminephrobacter aporrectodeae subsp. tuberculatae TaxID=1110392 RepID=A0ABT3KPQ2_9BURK|nr:cytochrome c1 [Verminephrobacter aporrectodeae]MCW5220738.1 cytochrome c1 [Verminephrobacter aporrectodeae subsp. tuberculatae]MCW5255308.1 cytochrome c1 [Verminephrobacter aporrectodeae subsp. tuberculatae]MCW5290033.1 cytochrome c1 [Verminephrobacter aporrectodeae subsp. tuberculatae]MCW5320294.1 cytochrome c1 [Verminephrobacter aporrectodeae subsp. tuberculatae]MCW8175526.1 cytochrome c1 [Verminephrobacter aporrectodeae subsp. tuberculatae]
MKKIIRTLIAAFGLAAGVVHAAGDEAISWDRAPKQTTDLASLQNGAKLFVNYCLNCHSAAFMRFNRLRDIGLTEQQIKDNLLFTTDKVGETMKAAIDPKQAKEWFGANPPDLTLIARSRAGHGGTGADYLYTFLRSFYRDDTKATGWNNLVFPSVGMPHALWQLQGERHPVFEEHESHGHKTRVFKGWEQATPGSMTPLQFDENIADLVNYLQWMGEPGQNTRRRVGVWVLIFLGLLTLTTWRLHAAYWKDVK